MTSEFDDLERGVEDLQSQGMKEHTKGHPGWDKVGFVSNLIFNCCYFPAISWSGGELLEIRLLDNHLLYTFGRKSTARHKINQLLKSS